MPFLFLLLLTLTCLQESWPEPVFKTSYPLLDAAVGTILTWGVMLALIVRVMVQARAAARHIDADPAQRSTAMRRFGRQRRQHIVALVIVQVVALYVFGWGWIARGLWPFAGVQIALLLPVVTSLFISWMCFYDLDRLSQQLTAAADEPPYMTRGAYVGLQARHNLLLVVPPLCLLLFQQVLFMAFPGLRHDSLFTPIFAVGMLALAFIGLPWLLRIFLGLKPLPDGPLRRRLLETARRLRFRFNDILLWDTRYTSANAMVTGFVPFLRYVVVTDRLVSELSEDEIEAVFGHEVGHIKHQHMLYYLGFLLASLAAVGGVWTVVLGALRHDVFPGLVGGAEAGDGVWGWLTQYEIVATVSLLAVLSLYIFLVFGFVSRRCERQADVFGARTASCGVFIRALEKVASLNGIHRERPGWLSSWQHSTIAKRVAFLRRMDADPVVESRFQRRVGLVKWGIAFALVAVLVALGPERVWAVVSPVPPQSSQSERQTEAASPAAAGEASAEGGQAGEASDVRWWIALGLMGVSLVLFLVASRVRDPRRREEAGDPHTTDAVELAELDTTVAVGIKPSHPISA